VQCRFFYCRVRKEDLMRERRFAAPRGTADDVERKLRQTTPQNLVETANSGWQQIDLHLAGSFRSGHGGFACACLRLLYHGLLPGVMVRTSSNVAHTVCRSCRV